MSYQDLTDAVNAGKAAVVRQLLQHSDSKDGEVWSKNTMLRAAYENRSAAVSALIENGVSPNVQDDLGYTPLHWAVRQGHELVVRMLVDHGADVNALNQDGATPLHLAAEGNMGSITTFLIERGASPTAMTLDKRTPLHVAAWRGSKAAADAILRICCWTDGAPGEGQPQAHAVLDLTNDKGETPLACAASRGNASILQLLVDVGSDIRQPNFWGQSPLHLAANGGYTAAVELLLRCSADIDSLAQDLSTPLFSAAERGSGPTCKMLLANKASLEVHAANGRGVIHAAAERGGIEALEVFLAANVLVDARSEEGRTPLSYAAARGHMKACTFLLENSADVNAADTLGQTPLHAAAAAGRPQVIDLLFHKAARLEAHDTNGQTPIMLALSMHQDAALRMLVRRGAVLPKEYTEPVADLMREIDREIVQEKLEEDDIFMRDLQQTERDFDIARVKLLTLTRGRSTSRASAATKVAEQELKVAQQGVKVVKAAVARLQDEADLLQHSIAEIDGENTLVEAELEKVRARVETIASANAGQKEIVATTRAQHQFAAAAAETATRQEAAIREPMTGVDTEMQELQESIARERDAAAALRLELRDVKVQMERWHNSKREAAALSHKAHTLLNKKNTTPKDSPREEGG
mmetsp:Transcript_49473/g.117734  ORF Transcript_49473/g.117734 Transcript_49473/m.117734 type:complete len:640 (-) Transcript_49473:141-2060(-)